MPYREPDLTDPQELIGVSVPGGPEAMTEMAWVIAEEFARLGHDRDRILWLFENPFYAGTHRAYQSLGHDAVVSIVDECVAVWGRVRPVDHDKE